MHLALKMEKKKSYDLRMSRGGKKQKQNRNDLQNVTLLPQFLVTTAMK